MPSQRHSPTPSARALPPPDISRISTIPMRTTQSCEPFSRATPTHLARRTSMPKVLVLYYSSYGHIEAMAQAQAEGARQIPGAQVEVKRVPELVPLEICRASGFRLDQPAPIAEPAELERYDAIIFGTPTRFGNMAAQMRNFLDQTGALWSRGA